MTLRAWVQMLDMYFQLNLMPEEDAIKFAALQLEGLAHKWWNHGMITLGHNQITSYIDSTEALIEKFDNKDPELHFKELAQLKQWTSVENYIAEFLRLAVLVTNITPNGLLMLFMEDGSKDLVQLQCNRPIKR